MHPANPQTAAFSEDDIRAALRDCYAPELPCNIVDLGLVYGVALTLDRDAPGAGIPGVPERYRVDIQLTLTTPGYAAQTQIVAQIENRLAAFERVSKTEVELVWQPAWTPERISPECRKRLGIDEGSRQIGIDNEHGRSTALPARKNDLVQLR
jgi:metal-sulfur cluster biosynthetic enzyme